jgi:hypothetical protein
LALCDWSFEENISKILICNLVKKMFYFLWPTKKSCIILLCKGQLNFFHKYVNLKGICDFLKLKIMKALLQTNVISYFKF